MQEHRRKSPRFPSDSLPEAIARTSLAYEKEGRHPVPTSIFAQDLGYKDATSGSSLTALATLKYFGLVTAPARGMLAVSEDFEEYKYSEDKQTVRTILRKWLRSPALYRELLDQFDQHLPSDNAIKYQLVKMGFQGKAVDLSLRLFKESVDFAGYYDNDEPELIIDSPPIESAPLPNTGITIVPSPAEVKLPGAVPMLNIDRIPIRLSGNRRAWIEIPTPFYEADKDIIRKHIEILVTDDAE
ncbi:MAG TPA: hypothetical protein VLC91_10965 [Spongiibacteraceae bacterium]|nr:hypothetical protein [Spongiibacteraceae bacterium]